MGFWGDIVTGPFLSYGFQHKLTGASSDITKTKVKKGALGCT